MKIRLELALLLESRLGTRIEHGILIIVHIAIVPRSELRLACGLLLCELLLERPFLFGRSDRHSRRCGFLLFFVGGCLPIALQTTKIASMRERERGPRSE